MLDLTGKCSKFVSQECVADIWLNAHFVQINVVNVLLVLNDPFWQIFSVKHDILTEMLKSRPCGIIFSVAQE